MSLTDPFAREAQAALSRGSGKRRLSDRDANHLSRRCRARHRFDPPHARHEPTDQLLALLDDVVLELVRRRRTDDLRALLERNVDLNHWNMSVGRPELDCDQRLESERCPVKLYTLGRFEVHTTSGALRFEGKAPRKPLELAKVLIALGGRSVLVNQLIDIVWPAIESDGQKAFDITVHRLRRLLGSDEALQVSDHRVTLNPKVAWVDVWELERTLGTLAPALHASEPPISLLEAAAPQVIHLYRGHFLASDPETRWHNSLRNRLSACFQRFASRLGEYWESQRKWNHALGLYQRAIELDPLAESFYRRQMACLQALGQRTEAIEVFRRCRQTLSVTLGVAPSAETVATYSRLLA